MANIKIQIVNESTVLSDAQVRAAVPAFQTQVRRDFAAAFGIDADLSFVPQGTNPDPSSWMLVILDNSDQANALGYHDLSPSGMPLAKAFAGEDIRNGLQWPVTVSHEMCEMLADPDVNLTVFVQDANPTSGVIYAYEVCDACEADSLAYNIGGVKVSDFVYPTWFESFRAEGSTQFDFGNKITKPFQILPGGYIGAFNVTSGSGWQQLTATAGGIKPVDLRRAGVRVDSRISRRSKPRKEWKRSVVRE